jgi:hypothetical protein
MNAIVLGTKLARRSLLVLGIALVAVLGFTAGVQAYSNPAYGPWKYHPQQYQARAYIAGSDYSDAQFFTCFGCYQGNSVGFANGYFQRVDSSWLNLQSGWVSVPYAGIIAVQASGLYTRIQAYAQVQNPVGDWGETSAADTAY